MCAATETSWLSSWILLIVSHSNSRPPMQAELRAWARAWSCPSWGLPLEETGFAAWIKYVPVVQRRSAFLPLCSRFLLTGWPSGLVRIFGLFALHRTVARKNTGH